MVRLGLTLPPELRSLELLGPLIESADFFELAPETMWQADGQGGLAPNGFHPRFRAIAERRGVPVVAHGLGLSLGSFDPGEAARFETWLERIRADHACFDFAWYTDHLGSTNLAGECLVLPMPLPMLPEVASQVRGRLQALQQVVPRVGFENSVFYFLLGDWLDEPAFINECLAGEGLHLLLDLHNLYTMGLNQGRDPAAYLERLDLGKVLEIHISGGSRSDPAWLPEGRSLRLDSHDAAVPEAVWSLLEEVLPRCPNLEGLCLERVEGSVEPGDVPLLRAEFERARELLS